MFRYIVFSVLLLYMLVQTKRVESTTLSTRLEYKTIDFVPQEYVAQLKPFELIGRKFYFIANKQLNWFQAAQECRQKGGNLINLEMEDERLLVGLRLNVSQSYWLDINRLGQEEYVSIATGLQTGYEKWIDEDVQHVKDPNEMDEELNCVVLVSDYEDGFVMKQAQCLEKANFICQLSSPRTISIVVW
ncbi:C-type lectin 37Db-like [Drosophila novamexicana]|uniref:C-type lectin 37Db-like n=1 Tax=Drosophila novamexicana TaxID=47314 RepID=UPI0011E5B7A1|nr:C-type lectin 37Db-like [Drosophila novamexicana]